VLKMCLLSNKTFTCEFLDIAQRYSWGFRCSRIWRYVTR